MVRRKYINDRLNRNLREEGSKGNTRKCITLKLDYNFQPLHSTSIQQSYKWARDGMLGYGLPGYMLQKTNLPAV